MGFEIDDKKLKRAGLDYWHLLGVKYYEGLDDFFSQNPDATCYYASTKAVNRYSDIKYKDGDYIFFGKETKGLPEDLLYKNKNNCIRIPMIDEARSLNLSNTVAIATYEVLRQWGFPELLCQGELTRYDW